MCWIKGDGSKFCSHGKAPPPQLPNSEVVTTPELGTKHKQSWTSGEGGATSSVVLILRMLKTFPCRAKGSSLPSTLTSWARNKNNKLFLWPSVGPKPRESCPMQRENGAVCSPGCSRGCRNTAKPGLSKPRLYLKPGASAQERELQGIPLNTES